MCEARKTRESTPGAKVRMTDHSTGYDIRIRRLSSMYDVGKLYLYKLRDLNILCGLGGGGKCEFQIKTNEVSLSCSCTCLMFLPLLERT